MALRYPGQWKFEGVGFAVPLGGVYAFVDLLKDVADGSKTAVEDFKVSFGGSGSSSSYDWAVSDLSTLMESRAENAAVFVDSVWKCIEDAKSRGLLVPSAKAVNKILNEYGVPLRVDPPDLLLIGGDSAIVDAAATSDGFTTDGTVPTFVLKGRIGAGGYGMVYRATRSTAIDEFEYALKVLDPSPFVTDPEKAIERFRREVKALRLLQHRAIVQYFEAGLTFDKKPYLVMPLVEGADLRTAASLMSQSERLSMFIEILSALEYAHKHDVLHRDL